MPFSQHRLARASLIAASTLILAAIACNSPAGTPPTATAPVVIEQLPTTDPAVPTPADSLPAAPTPTTDSASQSTPLPVPPAVPAANADYNGISFYRNNALASGWEVEITPVGDGQGPFASPSHYYFSLTGYALADTNRSGEIRVYPLDNFNDQYPDHNAEIARLQEFIKTKPTDVPQQQQIPNPSVLTAPEVFHVQVQFVQFQNGEGVRYITTFKHDVSPVTSREIFYTFQGLTYDGQYYVSAILPVSHASLPAEYPLEGSEAYNEFANQYETYLQNIITTLNGADPASFTPSLTLLDELVNSINVTPAP